ncbi:MAG: class I SAM-dependent methyltransferase [Bacteroidales bacterium]|nr:class I SAM-dependent methyltransferase [Bacteroidales bacterium]
MLAEINRSTWVKTVHPQMIAGHLQGKILEMISLMINPRRILEIGTFTGYSSICLAKGLSEDGHLYTIEKDDEITEFAGSYIQRSGLSDRITLLTGDAREIVPGMDESFDLVYLDAEKDEYLDYYSLVFPKLRSGGFILADNVLWGGKVLEAPEAGDHFTKGILAFNETIRKDTLVEQVILPVRDGIMLIRKI